VKHVRNETLREEVFHTTLPSGLRVSFCPKPGFQKKYASYSTFYGSVDNMLVAADGAATQVPDGIAHFLEHSLFETDRGNASDLFALNGAYNNAATSFTTTTYLFAASELFWENLKLLVEFVEVPSFLAEKVEKERGIIEQEIRGYDDSPDWVSYTGLLEGLFQKHPIGIDIAGTVESIQPIDVPLLTSCYEQFYQPANMHLFVVGDLDRDELFAFVDKTSRPTASGTGSVERLYPDEPETVRRRRKVVEMDVAMPKLILGFKEIGVPTTGREFVQREFVSQMALDILFGRSSDAYSELYERQIIRDDFWSYYNCGAEIGYAMIGGDTPDAEALENELLERIDRLRGQPLDDDDFEREKRRFIGGFIRGFNSLEYIANNYTGYLFHEFELFDTIDVLGEITRELVEERVAAMLDPARCASFVVAPRG